MKASSSSSQLSLSSSAEQRQATTAPPPPAPLLITIGPPCSGKTTLLSRLQQQQQQQVCSLENTTTPLRLYDVTLDNQPDVYVDVPVEYFLNHNQHDDCNDTNNDDAAPLQTIIQYKTLHDRIYDNVTNGELRAILQRWNGKLSATDFVSSISRLHHYQQEQQSKQQRRYGSKDGKVSNVTNTTTTTTTAAANTATMATTLLLTKTVEDLLCQQATHCDDDDTKATTPLSTSVPLPPTIQLYCVESLFRPHARTNRTGLESARDELWRLGTTGSNTTITNATGTTNTANQAGDNNAIVAWGNTNTRPREYRDALHVAAVSQRPVYFILPSFHRSDDNAMNLQHEESNDGSDGKDAAQEQYNYWLPHLSIQELMKRNVLRMLSTGKYIPARTLIESQRRVQRLLDTAKQNVKARTAQRQDSFSNNAMNTNRSNESTSSTSSADTLNEQQQCYRNNCFTKFQLDQELARMANYEMGEDRTVKRIKVATPRKRHWRRGMTVNKKQTRQTRTTSRGRQQRQQKRPTSPASNQPNPRRNDDTM